VGERKGSIVSGSSSPAEAPAKTDLGVLTLRYRLKSRRPRRRALITQMRPITSTKANSRSLDI
jgi:hypothetical protein